MPLPAFAISKSRPPQPEPCVRLTQPELQLSQLSQAVGTDQEVWDWIASRSATTKHSYAARLLLALVIFEGYELFPADDPGSRQEAGDR